jgi:predicted secreted Zn-dependent protease
MISELKMREEGHAKIADEYGKEIFGANQPISAEGNTQAEALQGLKAEYQKIANERQNTLNDREKAYDFETDSGRNQSQAKRDDLRGKDVRLDCP